MLYEYILQFDNVTIGIMQVNNITIDIIYMCINDY